MVRARWPVALLVLWSLYVWVTRIVNVVGGDEASKPLAVAVAVSVLVLAVAAGVVLAAARGRALTAVEARIWYAFAGWTTAVWLVRGAEISLSDHAVGFKVVHVALGALSIVLAGMTVRSARHEVVAGGHSSDLRVGL